MTIPKQHVELVKARANPSDVIGDYVSLTLRGPKRRGEWIGICPFHDERTASFSVTDMKLFYHCFGCGANGSLFDFLIRHQGITFQEAVLVVAKKYSIRLPSGETKTTNKKIKDRKRRAKRIARVRAKEKASQKDLSEFLLFPRVRSGKRRVGKVFKM